MCAVRTRTLWRLIVRKSLSLKLQFLQHKYPLFAVGFTGGGSEFILSLWLVDVRLSWGY